MTDCKVLFPISELYPFYKIGGLGDVAHSLPKALLKQGVDVRVIMPAHPEIAVKDFKQTLEFEVIYDHDHLPVTLYQTNFPGTNQPVYFLHEPNYISQKTDASDDNVDKFAVFNLAVATWLNVVDYGWKPHLVHLHDWHTGLIPIISKQTYQNHQLPFVLTVHNLGYQGRTSKSVLQKMGFSPAVEADLKQGMPEGKLNVLMTGIHYADKVIPVSPSYAQEILTAEHGCELETQLQQYPDKIEGILNGLDLDTFNPITDPNLEFNYTITTAISGKASNKKQLFEIRKWPYHQQIALLGYVGRVDPDQKGVQLIIQAIEEGFLGQKDTPFIFLGTGDPALEKALAKAAHAVPFADVNLVYDEALASQLYAGADLMLIPSRYEPCGLVQLIAMRYGSLPVARATGGLVDTIKHEQTGYLFEVYSTQALISAVSHAQNHWRQHQSELVRRAMKQDLDWYRSAGRYKKVYLELLNQ